MYLGKIMDLTDRDVLYSTPMHPYTHALMSAVPVPDPEKESRRERILLVGDLPSPINPPTGCVFHTRCPKYRQILGETDQQQCRDVVPMLELKADDHFVACHFPQVRADIAAAVDVGVTAEEVTAEQAEAAEAAVAEVTEALTAHAAEEHPEA
jgi:oligopeptide/dipeptide ABC transporter ATP-binding protein